MGKFEEHGTFKVSARGQILISIVAGQWNMETTLRYFEEAKKVASKLIGKPWAQIVDFNDWQLGVPETNEHTVEFQGWLHRNGLEFKAIIIQSDLKIEIMKSMVRNYDDIELKIFREEKEAVDWLKSKGISDKIGEKN